MIDKDSYGRVPVLSRADLERYCHLDDEDRRLIAARRRADTRLGFARGDIADADTWCRRREAGHTSAMFNLGVLLKRRGDLADPDAVHNLEIRPRAGGEKRNAGAWWRRVARIALRPRR
ncbi:DUF4158 domain-containing protein [Nocardia aurantiaca]|uniref:DUF4158 domain-containing protein n=1 Tax=Nocardia aurantiaca TaxID=2675850 RepID=A0A6I3L933_9NOCA|nr:DUF4158 domain-containing protein [Nocardia aurantiaca]MTE16935.1 DUF4158 domain-containing protein [Nocardia aurantiaca]